MLKVNQRITISGESVVNDTAICAYSAIIDLDNPEKMHVTQLQKDKELYKANRVECRADFAEFEDLAYSTQEAIILSINPDAVIEETVNPEEVEEVIPEAAVEEVTETEAE